MATIHPDIGHILLNSAGAYRERDILEQLQTDLPVGFDVFHGVGFSSTHGDKQYYGEIDVLVLSPAGHLVALEIKAGEVSVSEQGLFKQYKSGPKDIRQQVQQQRGTWLSILKKNGFEGVTLHHFLVLPDQMVAEGSATFPRDRIIDSGQIAELGYLIQRSIPLDPCEASVRSKLMSFIESRFELIPDPSLRIGQSQRANRILAEGLATWVPRIFHPSRAYQINATAGSGKTQLALALLRAAAQQNKRSTYICYNRPLADHISRIAPVQTIASNFDELCIAFLKKSEVQLDFSDRNLFRRAQAAYVQHLKSSDPTLDLLIIDEAQDFDFEWIEALVASVKSDGTIYLLSDDSQMLYERTSFELSDAVMIECHENFRSPKRIVDVINALGLSSHLVQARSVQLGELPEFVSYDSSDPSGLLATQRVISRLLSEGYAKDQITLLSFSGRDKSVLLKSPSLGPYSVRSFSGKYSLDSEPLFSPGDFLAETVYRFKGQSSPVIVFCEIDFTELATRELRKLFVGMTRAQYHLVCIMSEQAQELLAARLQA
jgi:thymidine kinase